MENLTTEFRSYRTKKADFTYNLLSSRLRGFEPGDFELEQPSRISLIESFSRILNPASAQSSYLSGVPHHRVMRVFERAGYKPYEVEFGTNIISFSCPFFEDGPSYLVILFRVDEQKDDCWACTLACSLNKKLGHDVIDRLNFETTWVRLNNQFSTTAIEGHFLLVDISDSAIETYSHYWYNIVSDIAQSLGSDARNESRLDADKSQIKDRRFARSQTLRIRQSLADLTNWGHERSPVQPRKDCETCGGNGYVTVNKQRQKCTACNGTGLSRSA